MENKGKIGWFEAAPGEKSLSAILSLLSFLASVMFGYMTMSLATKPAANTDIGIWLTALFLGSATGIKLGRTTLAAWSNTQSEKNAKDCSGEKSLTITRKETIE